MFKLFFEDENHIREIGDFNSIGEASDYAAEWAGRWTSTEDDMFELAQGLTIETPDGGVYGDVTSQSMSFLYFAN